MEAKSVLQILTKGIPFDRIEKNIHPGISSDIPHAPKRAPGLAPDEVKLAVKNALRYFPKQYHAALAGEFLAELEQEGHIYMRRFRPTEYEMKAYPIDAYPAKTAVGRTLQLMIMNNLDRRVAQYPEELITYGGNGSVFSNWAQYHLVMAYLSQLEDDQTLSLYSGHPLGLFPAPKAAPRLVITNGMVIPNYSSKADYDKMYAMGVSQYGQMTAGSFCYIGPQGIVHGTTITVLNAARKYIHSAASSSSPAPSSGLGALAGHVFVSSGLGGMSGAQGKAAVICGGIAVIAEVDGAAIQKRHSQGWIMEVESDVTALIARIRKARAASPPQPLSIAFHGNIVTLWEAFAAEAEKSEGKELLVEIGSDQTSLHNAFGGGYIPVQTTLEEARQLISKDPAKFKELVQESLRRHVAAINRLTKLGMRFFDYGNSFLLEASRAGAEVMSTDGSRGFRYPSYIQEFVGAVFGLGFGPFRWVCTSGLEEDLQRTDDIARDVMRKLRETAPPRVAAQLDDNLLWIEKAGENKLVVGSQARILYADAEGRVAIALAFNEAIREGRLKGPVILSRDHHDVSGTDSPYRETSNIYDGSAFTADMAVQNCIGDAIRGASWVALHNGGGVGWGEVMNGGFGLVLEGTDESAARAKAMLSWDVNNGVARRAWAGEDNASFALQRALERDSRLQVTVPVPADEDAIERAFAAAR